MADSEVVRVGTGDFLFAFAHISLPADGQLTSWSRSCMCLITVDLANLSLH
jgi:hypothetical protein